jgi:hypothetical protein
VNQTIDELIREIDALDFEAKVADNTRRRAEEVRDFSTEQACKLRRILKQRLEEEKK